MENSEQFDIDLEELKSMLQPPKEDPYMTTQSEAKITQTAVNESLSETHGDSAEHSKANADGWQKSVLLYLHDLIYLLAILLVVSMLLLRVVVVSGTSMYDTLLDGDYLFVLSNALYREPNAGDIVVITKESFDDGAPIVKRVIATEGQTVDIDFNLGIVYVDGVALDEPYVYSPTTTMEGVSFPQTVPEGCIFVLGDNRAVSRDSRSPDIGMIYEEEVLGKVIFLFIPGTNGTDIYGNPNEPRDWSRIGVVE